MATTSMAPLLPMWRSPTASHCSCSPRPLRPQDSWDDDEAYAASTSSTRLVQCLNFLSQVERIDVRAIDPKRFREPVVRLDVFLSDDDDDHGDVASATHKPTYQIERSLAEFEALRDDVLYWTQRDAAAGCAVCADFQTRSATWQPPHWPRHRLLRRLFLFPSSTTASDKLLQVMVDDVLAFSRSQLRFSGNGDGDDLCTALAQVPALLTSFLVRHELYMDE